MNGGRQGIRLALAALIGIAVSSCAAAGSFTASTQPPTPYPPPGYAHTVQSSHVALYWNCARPDPTVVEVSGLAFNPWSPQSVRFLEIELAGVGPWERTVSEAQTKAPDIQIFTNQSTAFHLTLRTKGTESRIDLYYRYQFQDDGGHDQFQVSSLAWDGPALFAQAQQQQFRVRDACSDTQHLAR